MATATTFADGDLETIANRQIRKFHYAGFSRETSAAIPAIRHHPIRTGRYHCTSSAYATAAIVAARTVSCRRFAVDEATAVAATATVSAGYLVGVLSNRHRGGSAAATAAATACAVQVQTLNAKCAATAAAATCGSRDDGQTKRCSPWPFESSGFDDPPESRFSHFNTPPIHDPFEVGLEGA